MGWGYENSSRLDQSFSPSIPMNYMVSIMFGMGKISLMIIWEFLVIGLLYISLEARGLSLTVKLSSRSTLDMDMKNLGIHFFGIQLTRMLSEVEMCSYYSWFGEIRKAKRH